MESTNQEEWVQKLEQKLIELREQRIKVDEANETLRKRLATLTTHLDTLDAKYGKNGTEVPVIDDEGSEPTKESKVEETEAESETKTPSENESSESTASET